jgi:hypothetical protein
MDSLNWNRKLRENEYTQRRITFGKYMGRQIKNIPTDYIKWGVLNFKGDWAEYFSRELQRREPQYKK